MLIDLRISNLAIIEHSEIQCGPGLNVLTGETGAGKSILINALGLLIGERAASDRVGGSNAAAKGDTPNGTGANGTSNGNTPAAKATPARALVEGEFDLTYAPAAEAYLSEQEFTVDDHQLVIAREISADGRNRVRLNGRLATASTLRELGSLLIDIHGQHEHQMLLNADTHLGFLDAFGDTAHTTLRTTTREKYLKWREAQRRLDELSGNEQQRAQRLDMLQFQADEIDAAAPQPDEDTQLVDERLRLMNAEKLRAAASLCRDALLGQDEPGALTLLQQALKAAKEIHAFDGSVAEWAEELQSAIYQIEDAASEARSYADLMEADPLRLEEVEARLHRLNRLKRKYGDSLERVIAYRAEIEEELQRLNLSDTEL
ncbi:MAG: AAA family ATPase, partial [Abitibacteriaceae bacterium]|nr:AAA family ATPase [Abditibacteriaceae bacterium]